MLVAAVDVVPARAELQPARGSHGREAPLGLALVVVHVSEALATGC
jgi:hypothetical protein